MIQSDRGDHAHLAVDDVGRVQTAAQTDLNDAHVDLLLRKVLVGQTGNQLKETQIPDLVALLEDLGHHVLDLPL